jgi:hypothetical protein
MKHTTKNILSFLLVFTLVLSASFPALAEEFLSEGSWGEVITVKDGNVGIGITAPKQKLHVNGGLNIDGNSFGTGDGAGLYGDNGASGHLTLVTDGKMQMKINGNGNIKIQESLEVGDLVNAGTLQVRGGANFADKVGIGTIENNYIPQKANWNYNITLNGKDTSSIGFHDSGHSVGSIRYKEKLFTIGDDDGWGTANVYFPGNIGIGIDKPGAKLDINGGIAISGTTVIDSNGNWTGNATGLKGADGASGVQGARGPKGNTGARGPKGNTGAIGPQGFSAGCLASTVTRIRECWGGAATWRNSAYVAPWCPGNGYASMLTTPVHTYISVKGQNTSWNRSFICIPLNRLRD